MFFFSVPQVVYRRNSGEFTEADMAKNTSRNRITLACTVCKQRNYDTFKNKKNDPDRIELKKYCKFCKTHTAHKETK